MSIKSLEGTPRLLRDVPIVERYFYFREEQFEQLRVRSIWGEVLFVNVEERHGVPVGAVLVGDPNRVHTEMGMFFIIFDEGIFSALRGMSYIPGYYTETNEHVEMHRGTLAWAFSVAWNYEMLNEEGRGEWSETLRLIGMDLTRYHHPKLVMAGVYAGSAGHLAEEGLDTRTNLVYASDQSLVEWTRLAGQSFAHFDMRRVALVSQLDRIWQTLGLIRRLCTEVLSLRKHGEAGFALSLEEMRRRFAFGQELAASVYSAPWPSGAWIRERFEALQSEEYDPLVVLTTLQAILRHCDRLNGWRTLQEVLISISLMERFGQFVEDQDVIGFVYALQGAHRSLAISDTGLAADVEDDLRIATASLMARDFVATKDCLKRALARMS